MLRDRRGQIRVLEAFLASAVVFSALIISVPLSLSLNKGLDSEALHTIGLNTLIELDRDGGLGLLVSNNNWSTLSSRLSILLPLGVAYNLTVYDEYMKIVNDSPISGGGSLVNNVVSINYPLADRDGSRFYLIRLQLSWMK